MLKLLPSWGDWVVWLLWQVVKINLCPATQTKHVADVGRMPHGMLTCGMQVLICGGHVVHKHGKGLWCSANMFVVRGMGLCAPKYAPMCTPPQVWCQYGQNMRRTCASLSLPPSRTPCLPFRTFTLCLHPHISKREPVRAKLTS